MRKIQNRNFVFILWHIGVRTIHAGGKKKRNRDTIGMRFLRCLREYSQREIFFASYRPHIWIKMENFTFDHKLRNFPKYVSHVLDASCLPIVAGLILPQSPYNK